MAIRQVMTGSHFQTQPMSIGYKFPYHMDIYGPILITSSHSSHIIWYDMSMIFPINSPSISLGRSIGLGLGPLLIFPSAGIHPHSGDLQKLGPMGPQKNHDERWNIKKTSGNHMVSLGKWWSNNRLKNDEFFHIYLNLPEGTLWLFNIAMENHHC